VALQLPIDQWHAYLGDRTVADAILDLIVHNSYRIVLKGESMRRNKGRAGRPAATQKSKGH
jgi:DNA replication protein DnaC